MRPDRGPPGEPIGRSHDIPIGDLVHDNRRAFARHPDRGSRAADADISPVKISRRALVMASAYLRTRVEERANLSDLIDGSLDRAATESRDLTPDERTLLDGWEARAGALDAEIEQLIRQEEGAQRFTGQLGRLALTNERDERRAARDRDRTPVEIRSIGRRFVESEQFRTYRGHGSMEPVEFSVAELVETRAAITTGDLPANAYQFVPAAPTTTTPLLDAIGHELVSGSSVEFIVWGTSAGNASVVPEGQLKPEAPFASTPGNATLDTYAWWKAITRQALEDAPRMQSLIEGKLRAGVANALENAAAGVISGAAVTTITNADMLAGIRQGIATVQTAGFTPDAVLLNPADYADLDINAAAGANSGPVAFAGYWGLTPIAAAAIPAGTSYVANFKEAVTWFDRGVGNVFMTDSHADYFVRNQLIILAETRAAFAITDLSAMVAVTTGAGGAAASTSSSKA